MTHHTPRSRRRHRAVSAALAITSIALLASCADDDDNGDDDLPVGSDVVAAASGANTSTIPESDADVDDTAPVVTGRTDWYRPAVGDTWHWQLSGDVDPGFDVDVYDIDLFDVPASQIAQLHGDGKHVICYFSAGTAEDWRDDIGDFAESVQGAPLDDWEGERWLDIRSDDVLQVMLRRLDLAQQKGCDGVEPDNVQLYNSDTGFDIDRDQQISYNRALADAAHDRGLAIGLKNAAELIPVLLDDFDFSVNEECNDYDECAPYEAFVADGKPVFNAEYADRYVDDSQSRDELCAASAAAGFSTLVLPLDLDGAFRHSC